MGSGDMEQRISLWLMPATASRQTLAGLIADGCRRFEGPRFAPHVTLVGSVRLENTSIEAAMGRLAARVASFDAEVSEPAESSDYYRCCYLRLAPNRELLRARESAVVEVNGFPGEGYEPHVSLVYGDLSEAQRKAWLTYVDGRYPSTLRLDAMEAWNTTGPAWHWSCLARARLQDGC